jgi:hypothetical protein
MCKPYDPEYEMLKAMEMEVEQKLTTSYAQYLILTQLGEVVPQSAIKLINEKEFEVTADDGTFYFIVENGKIRPNKKEPKQFEVGQKYESVCWFTGGIGLYTVKAKDNKSVTFGVGHHELDGDYEGEDETYKLKHDDNGNEYVVLYEYGGHENCIRAGYDGYGNEMY